MSISFPVDPYTSSKIVRSAFNETEAVSVSRATALRDIDVINGRRPMPLHFTANSTSATDPGADLYEGRFRVTPYADGRYLNVELEAYVTSGTGNLRLSVGSTLGSWVAITTGSYDLYTLSVLCGVEVSGESLKVIGKGSGSNTVYARSLYRQTMWMTD